MFQYIFDVIKEIKTTQTGKTVEIDLRSERGTDTLVFDRDSAELLKSALQKQLK